MNKVFIIGRLTKAPELKTTPGDISVATFTVAVTRRMNREARSARGGTSDIREMPPARAAQAGKESDFLNVVAWRGLADNCAKYLVKGQQAAVCGELRTRSYDAKDGTKRYVTEIQADDVEFLAKPKGAENREAKDGMFAPDDGYMPDDDDLPF